MLMWVMSRPRDPAQLPHDAGLRRAHLPVGQRAGRVARSSSSTGVRVAGTHSLVWDEAVKISGADPDFHRRDLWEAIEAGAYPEWELRRAGLHRGSRPSSSASTSSTRPRSCRRSWCRVRPVGRMVLEPQSGQLLRRDRAGRVLHGARGARHRLHQRSAAAGPHLLVRRHAAHAPGRAELPRDPDQRAGRAGAQQPARRHPPPGDPPRPRRLRAELARRRLPVPGRRAQGFVSFPRSRVPGAGQGARQAGEVRRPLHAGARCSSTARRRWSRSTSSGRSASS